MVQRRGGQFTHARRGGPGGRSAALLCMVAAFPAVAGAAGIRPKSLLVYYGYPTSINRSFSVLAAARPVADAGPDLDALEAWIAGGVQVPATGRVTDATPRN